MPITIDGTPFKQIDDVANDKRKCFAAVFGKKHTCQKSDRHADSGSEQENFAAADNRIGHAAAGFARGLRQLGEEVPVK